MIGTLILCADDFGYRQGVDEGILGLASRGRLSAVSCMVTGENIHRTAGRLAALADRVDIGLHLALTELRPAKVAISKTSEPYTINALIGAAFARRLDGAKIEAEVRAQVDLFHEIFKRPPDFVDGHQHVHVLPMVRDVVFSLFEDGTLQRDVTCMRDCHEPFSAIVVRSESVFKASVIAALARRHHKRAKRLGLSMNQSFRGIYNFDARTPYRSRFNRFLAGGGTRVLIMCHPGVDDDRAKADMIASARRSEFEYFTSGEVLADIATAQFELARFSTP